MCGTKSRKLALLRERIDMSEKIDIDLNNTSADFSFGPPKETLETAGCTGGCPTYPGAPKTETGYPDCSKCPQFQKDGK